MEFNIPDISTLYYFNPLSFYIKLALKSTISDDDSSDFSFHHSLSWKHQIEKAVFRKGKVAFYVRGKANVGLYWLGSIVNKIFSERPLCMGNMCKAKKPL
ncbi:hypothetical protein ACFSO7_22010 [Bacillus sp. CGMCC 1.16607]|uniref:hypothetical protein n=1 Tax=Bacillus sp. CGMCC 1.16607 TaxID=3351842 RepID=UPI00362EE7D5